MDISDVVKAGSVGRSARDRLSDVSNYVSRTKQNFWMYAAIAVLIAGWIFVA